MTTDLEETLAKLGGDYAVMVRGVKKACANVPYVPRRRIGWRVYLKAACWLVFVGIGVSFFTLRGNLARQTAEMRPSIYTVAYLGTTEAAQELVRTQGADGSWQNDFLTQQNAAALREATTPEAAIAYRRAVRYLRQKGLQPLSAQELAARRDWQQA